MTRLSEYFLPTLKDPPADAEAISHVLMVRSGMVRQLGSGIWTYLPAGWRTQRRIEQIVRAEMDGIGALEMKMPVLQPQELWDATGRSEIPELFKLRDRKDARLVLAMTHEEAVTYHVAREMRSYRDLPRILYHLQVKERDEPRPRAGVLRTREFIMKDSYSFDRDESGLDASYERHTEAYGRIFDRCGLHWHRVTADVGVMGGLGADEFMAPCPAGEDAIALSDAGYAANVAVARATARQVELEQRLDAPQPVDTPDQRTIEEVSGLLGIDPGAMMKSVVVVAEGRGPVLALVRGDHSVNDVKLRAALKTDVRAATDEEIEAAYGSPAGFIGPVGATGIEIVADAALEGGRFVTGANEPGKHLLGVEPGRDFDAPLVDIRVVEEGDTCPNGGTIRIEKAIEIGNIFKLGTRYSEPLGATYLDESGSELPIVMGSYGLGPARVAAAAVEQFADEHGISWPKAISPFDIHLVGLGKPATPERELAEQVYAQLRQAGFDVLYDDRDANPGQKFVEAELLGCPVRVVAGKRSLDSGELELQVRRGTGKRSLPIEGAADALQELWQELE